MSVPEDDHAQMSQSLSREQKSAEASRHDLALKAGEQRRAAAPRGGVRRRALECAPARRTRRHLAGESCLELGESSWRRSSSVVVVFHGKSSDLLRYWSGRAYFRAPARGAGTRRRLLFIVTHNITRRLSSAPPPPRPRRHGPARNAASPQSAHPVQDAGHGLRHALGSSA